jgi:hypothetical protein
MVFWEPVFWAVEVFTIVAPEGQLDLEPTHLTFQTLRLPRFFEITGIFQLLMLVPYSKLGRKVAQMCNVRERFR